MPYRDSVQFLGVGLAVVTDVGGDECAHGDVTGRHRVEVKTGLDEHEAEMVEEVIEGLVRGEGGNVEVVSESLK